MIQKDIGKAVSNPRVQAIAQVHPFFAGITTLVTAEYQKDQEEAVTSMLHSLDAKLKTIDSRYIDETFLKSREGRRLMALLVGIVLRDGRKEKIRTATLLAFNLRLKSRLTIDEKELFVHVLDQTNPLQLSILKRAVIDMRQRERKHRGLGWEMLRDEYHERGVKALIFSQALRVLESNGLINQNTGTVHEKDQTHFITEFGEQFCDFCTEALEETSDYLNLNV